MGLTRVKVLYFGVARDMAGKGEEQFSQEAPASVRSVLAEAEKRHSDLSRIRGVISVAVDQELVRSEVVLREGATVALLPPVAGG